MSRRASRITVLSSLLLPMPVAMAAPLASTLSEDVLGVSRVPVAGVGDPARAHALGGSADGRVAGPMASLTRLAKEQRAALSPSEVAANGIPAAALRAYRTAEATMAIADPSCRLSWPLLAGIGRVESDHGRYAGAMVGRDGVSSPQIVGLPLNGAGAVAAIADTDDGALDGDTRWDRAVGPMQFIPSTWALVGVDGDGNGKRNPHDLDDAALAAAAYLCVGDRDLSTAQGLTEAVYSYNHSQEYVALVVAVARAYASGRVALPLLTASLSLPDGSGVPVALDNRRGVPIDASDEVPAGRKADEKADKGADDKPRATTNKNGQDRNDNGDRTGPPADSGTDGDRGDRGDDPTRRPTGGASTDGGGNGAKGGASGEGSERSNDEGEGSTKSPEPQTPETQTPETQTPEPTPAPDIEAPEAEEPVEPEPGHYFGTVEGTTGALTLNGHLLDTNGFNIELGQEVTVLALWANDTLVVQDVS